MKVAPVKAALLNNETMINPAWESSDDKTGIQPTIPVPAGTEIDHPDCWILCTLGKAVPLDDECKARIARHMNDPRRKKILQQVKQLRAAAGVERLDKKTLRWLEYMEKTYADELTAIEAP